jgi:hypothetical protein
MGIFCMRCLDTTMLEQKDNNMKMIVLIFVLLINVFSSNILNAETLGEAINARKTPLMPSTFNSSPSNSGTTNIPVLNDVSKQDANPIVWSLSGVGDEIKIQLLVDGKILKSPLKTGSKVGYWEIDSFDESNVYLYKVKGKSKLKTKNIIKVPFPEKGESGIALLNFLSNSSASTPPDLFKISSSLPVPNNGQPFVGNQIQSNQTQKADSSIAK